MNYTPERQAQINKSVIESGVAARVMDNLKNFQGSMDPPIKFGISDLNFSVEVRQDDENDGFNHTIHEPIIRHPDKTGKSEVSVAFSLDDLNSFGNAAESPLSREQYQLLLGLAVEKP